MSDQPRTSSRVALGTLVAGVVIAIGTLVAYVILRVNGIEGGEVLMFVTPILGALLVVEHVNSRSNTQDATLATLERRTNGELDDRIQANVRAVLAPLLTPPTTPPTT